MFHARLAMTTQGKGNPQVIMGLFLGNITLSRLGSLAPIYWALLRLGVTLIARSIRLSACLAPEMRMRGFTERGTRLFPVRLQETGGDIYKSMAPFFALLF